MTMSSGNIAPPSGPRPSDRWIPWYFVAFFVVLALICAVFVYIAASTHTGVVTENAYQEGLDYNQTIAASNKQQALGWSGKAVLTAGGDLSFTLIGADGTALTAAAVTARAVRPTQDGHDFTFQMIEIERGAYHAVIDFPMRGIWDVGFFAVLNGQEFQHTQRLMVTE